MNPMAIVDPHLLEVGILDFIFKVMILAISVGLGIAGYFIKQVFAIQGSMARDQADLRSKIAHQDSRIIEVRQDAQAAQHAIAKLERDIREDNRQILYRLDREDNRLIQVQKDISGLLTSTHMILENANKNTVQLTDHENRISRMEGSKE